LELCLAPLAGKTRDGFGGVGAIGITTQTL
jgi:hypothetical protein